MCDQLINLSYNSYYGTKSHSHKLIDKPIQQAASSCWLQIPVRTLISSSTCSIKIVTEQSASRSVAKNQLNNFLSGLHV